MYRKVDKTDRVFIRLENQLLNRVSFYHQRKIGQAIVENNFIRYQFDTQTSEKVEETRKWRQDLPDELPPVIDQFMAEANVEGEVLSTRLVYISPESKIFKIRPLPQNPCWIIRTLDDTARKVHIIDAVTGEPLGYGLPAPYEGFSMHGPDHPPDCDDSAPLWYDHAQNAHNWFETMGYDTIRDGSALGSVVQSHIQSDSTVMFYELDHGGATSFKNRCDDDIYPGFKTMPPWGLPLSEVAWDLPAQETGHLNMSSEGKGYPRIPLPIPMARPTLPTPIAPMMVEIVCCTGETVILSFPETMCPR